MSILRGFFWLIRFIVFILFFSFAMQNTELVTLRAFLGYTWTTPLVVLLLLVFVLGALLGLLANAMRYIRLRRELVVLRRELHRRKSLLVKQPQDAL